MNIDLNGLAITQTSRLPPSALCPHISLSLACSIMSIPNTLIHLRSLFRPKILRPDLRVPSIANVDWAELKRVGFNAVVIDKDNCLTLPKSDNLWPAIKDAWSGVLQTFNPKRVLVVSNSSGTSKDPGGLGAEILSRNLRAPVLLHRTPKPGCESDILAYFHGDLGAPKSYIPTLEVRRAVVEEDEDEKALLTRWRRDVEGPLCGPLETTTHKTGQNLHGANVEKRMVEAEVDPDVRGNESLSDLDKEGEEQPKGKEPTRIIVVGDRLFTDVVLARRLSSRLGKLPLLSSSSTSSTPSVPSTLAILTTSLPQPKDARLLRRLESFLTGDRLAPSPIDWGRYILTPPPPSDPSQSFSVSRLPWPISYAQPIVDRVNAINGRVRARIAKLHPSVWAIDNGPPMTWHPRTWRAWPVFLWSMRYTGIAGAFVGKYVKIGGAWLMAHIKAGVLWGWDQTKAAWRKRRVEMAENRQLQKEKSKVVEGESSDVVSVATEKPGPV